MVQSKNKVIWAVDAFSKDVALFKKMASFLKTWVKESDRVIEPVYVLSPDQVRVPSEIFSSIAVESEAQAKKTLKSTLRDIKLSHAEPVLLRSNDFSLRTAVKTLLDYARDNGVEFIALGTQSKKSVSRFLFGSFAESLIVHSDIPILLLTPECKPASSLKKLIFATDFSDASKAAFQQALDLAEEHRLSVTLFNRVEYSCDKTMELIRNNAEYELQVEKDLDKRSRAIQEMASLADARGIKVDVVIDSKPSHASIAQSILDVTAAAKGSLIAVAAESGSTRSTLLGSVAREVVRKSNIPVWVIRPIVKSASASESNARKGAA